ncbi:MAG: DUF6782 family putative metallopeptidase [Micavibrio sp.]
MSNTTDTENNVTYAQFGHHRRVAIAYTFNNYQPVRCTIIGDQPLFYMDHEGSYDADRFDPDLPEDTLTALENIEQGVEELQARIMRALEDEEPVVADIEQQQYAEKIMELFIDDIRQATSADKGSARFVKPSQPHELVEILSQSRMGALLLEAAAKYETQIVMGGAVSTAQYDRRQNTIYINPHLEQTDQVLLLGREVRRAWQHRHGALVHPLTFHPDQAVLVHRSQVADLCVGMVRMAWELQLAGLPAAWERLEASSLEDLTRAFSREAYMDFRSVANGEACAATFEAWFLSERCCQEDRRLIQQMLADYQGYVFENINPSLQVTAELILALGAQPEGKNYLSPYVNTILADSLFTEIRDRSNANFLWFIKFERSFRETEQELQTSETGSGSGAHQKSQPDLLADNNKRFGDQHEQKADIVTLPRGKAHAGIFKGDLSQSAGGATVIAFRTQQPGKA